MTGAPIISVTRIASAWADWIASAQHRPARPQVCSNARRPISMSMPSTLLIGSSARRRGGPAPRTHAASRERRARHGLTPTSPGGRRGGGRQKARASGEIEHIARACGRFTTSIDSARAAGRPVQGHVATVYYTASAFCAASVGAHPHMHALDRDFASAA